MGRPRSIDKAIANLIKWAERPEWADKYQSVFEALVGPVCRRHEMTPDQLAQTLDQAGYGGMIFGMVFEDFLTRRWPDGRNLVDDYLARRGWREDPPGRRYLQMLRDSTLSVYEVVEVAPGQHCDLVPLLEGGPPVRVHENLGTRNLVRWDRIAARVLREGDRYRFSGGILPLSHELSRELGIIIEQALSKTSRSLEEGSGPAASAALPEDALMSLTREALAPAITQLWLDDTLKRLTAPPPRMINRDGEEVLFCETRFPVLEKDTEAIIALLDEAADWVRAEGATPFWNWVSPEDSPLPSGQGEGFCLVGQLSGGGSILGTLELLPSTLALHTNSPGRGDRGQRVLADLLGARIGKPLITLTTLQQALAERDQRPKESKEKDALDPQLAARLEREFLDEHYRKIVDVPIPALGNLSPRECAQTPRGRIELVEWLKQVENHELHRAARDGKTPYDAGWMWKALGVADLR